MAQMIAVLRGLGRRLRAALTPPRVAFLAVLAFYYFRYFTYDGWRVGADGFYSWIFARSFAFDHDMHFANDYRLCGDPWQANSHEGSADGRPGNPFYIGPALLWAPMLAVVRRVYALPPNASAAWRAGCDGPWAIGTLSLGALIGAVVCWIGYRAARRHASEPVSIAAMLVIALCTPLTHFATLIAVYSHVWAAFGVALSLITWLRATERPESTGRWFLAGMGVGVAALMRVQGAILLLPLAMALASRIVDAMREKRSPWRDVAMGLVVLAGFMSLFWIQLATYKVLYGRWWVVPQGRAYVRWGHSHPWLTLFAGRSGFFSWHPMHWLGALGLVVLAARKKSRLLAAGVFVPFAADVYLNGAAYWHGGASFGARRLTSVAAPWVLTTAVFLQALWRWLAARPAALKVSLATGWLLPWAVINVGASSGSSRGRLAYDRSVPMPELYGTGLRIGLEPIYSSIGNPLTLPAGLLFSLRYRLPPQRFDLVSNGGYFEHSYHPVALAGVDTLNLGDASFAPLLVGMRHSPEGLHLRPGVPGRLITELAWHSITHVALLASASGPRPVTLRVSNGSFFTRRPVAAVTVRGAMTAEFIAPPGAFDSGINELIFEADGPLLLRSWRWIDRAVHDSSIH